MGAVASAAGSSLLEGIAQATEISRAIGIDIGAYRLSLYGFLSAILVGLLLWFTVRLTLRTIKWLLRRNDQIDETQRLLIEKLTGIILFGVATLAGIDLLGIDLTALAVFSGALGLAVGFGLQKTVGNLIAGIILLMDRSIKPGDVIVVGDGSAIGGGNNGGFANVGRVAKIGVRAVSVITRDGKKHLIPNELLMTQPVENWSYSNPDVRVRMKVPVGYDSDLRLAQSLIIAAAKGNARVLAEPEPMVWVTGFGERAVDHELRLWIADPESGLGNVQGEVFMAIWDAFRAHGITLPYPRIDVELRGAAQDAAPQA
ncbi:mechanosensitive ion channel [Sphingomonas lacunae]|uniref:Mechanosensitive ion channel n=1 Tax=Sphingomonas lacunae TaxID=2698828 RepID=A0A6M4ASI3_9SPHN|nr:mechanosensitive ion channel [Sphingomonas lacunae]